ncbi:MAG TPA: hypothetical protein VE173_07745, partial [Longimicrobiales bacterium]|nr:hypothetical protein [Longimicrobiales bacterium]
MIRSRWPVALAALFVLLLGWYLYYTQQIVEALQENTQTLAEIYGETWAGVTTTDASEQTTALFNLLGVVIRTGIPLVLTAQGGEAGRDTVLDAVNLSFQADRDTPEGQQRLLSYAERLDLRHDPVGDSVTQQLIHYGDPVQVRNLRWIRWLQVAGLLLVAG